MSRVIDHWRDLPDFGSDSPHQGKVSIQVSAEVVDHIVGKHVGNRSEPWDQWMPAELVQRLRASIQGGQGKKPRADVPVKMAEEFVQLLEKDTCKACERPLVMVFERVPNHSKMWLTHWQVVLPHGAVAIVRFWGRKGSLRTAFFLGRSIREPDPDKRWRRTVRFLVSRYGRLEVNRGWLQPDAGMVTDEESPRRSIRYVSPARWGFDESLDGAPYRGRLGTWDDAKLPVVKKKESWRAKFPRR